MVSALSTVDTDDMSIKTNVTIENTINRQEIKTKGIWDTGATGSVITKSIAAKLGLVPITYNDVRGVHGVRRVPVYYVKVTLNNENISLNTFVTECDELSDNESIGMLIGMNIISMGDFAVTSKDGKIFMSFRVPSLERIDFVRDIDEYNRYLKIHELNLKRNVTDKCPCGSGKLYKNCHGQSVYSEK